MKMRRDRKELLSNAAQFCAKKNTVLLTSYSFCMKENTLFPTIG